MWVKILETNQFNLFSLFHIFSFQYKRCLSPSITAFQLHTAFWCLKAWKMLLQSLLKLLHNNSAPKRPLLVLLHCHNFSVIVSKLFASVVDNFHFFHWINEFSLLNLGVAKFAQQSVPVVGTKYFAQNNGYLNKLLVYLTSQPSHFKHSD